MARLHHLRTRNGIVVVVVVVVVVVRSSVRHVDRMRDAVAASVEVVESCIAASLETRRRRAAQSQPRIVAIGMMMAGASSSGTIDDRGRG